MAGQIKKAWQSYLQEIGTDVQTMYQRQITSEAFKAGWRQGAGAKPSGPPRSLEEAEQGAQYAARKVAECCPQGWRFLLLMASEGEAGNMTYASSVNRDDAKKILEELLDNWNSDKNGL